LNFLAAMLKEGIRTNKKQTLSVTDARAIMIENGFALPVKDSHIRQILRDNRLSTADTAKAAPHQFYAAAQELFAAARVHVVKSGLGFGGDWVEAAAEGFAAFAVPCHIESHRYTRKRVMALGLR
jgi:hypothetical protein